MSATEQQRPASTEPGAEAPGLQHEADIGSGEKTPGEQDTDEMIKTIPAKPKDQPAGSR